MNVLVLLVVTLIIILISHNIIKMYRLNEYVKDVPLLPLRIFKGLITTNKTFIDLFNIIEQMTGFKDSLTKFWIGNKLVVVCNDPENSKLILMSKNCVDKPYLYRMIAGAGDGIFSSCGNNWKNDRKKINTVFTLSILKTFIPIFNRHFAQLAKNLEKRLNQPDFDVTNYIFSCNLDLVCETILRFDLRTQIGENAKALNFMARLWKISVTRVSSLLLHPNIIYRFTKLHAEETKIIDYFLEIGPSVLRNAQSNITRCQREPSEHCEKMTACNENGSTSMILIDKLLEMERQGIISRERLIDQINTFLVAGTDTSSVTMLTVLLMLAIHQDVQDRVYEEICANVQDIECLDYDTVSKLDYMERTIKETMRLYPLSQVLVRETDADVQLNGCIVPKGTILLLSIFKMHRSKDIWGPTASEFDPERFLSESFAEQHPYAYLPFSAGPRNCVGAKYAMISMKMMLCHILTAYKLNTTIKVSDIVLKFELMLKIENQCLVQLERRK